jgi:hypothetical protein
MRSLFLVGGFYLRPSNILMRVISKFSSYLSGNTLRPCYKDQLLKSTETTAVYCENCINPLKTWLELSWVELSWRCDRRSVGLSVLVSNTPLGPMTRFFFFLSFAGQLVCSSSSGALSDEKSKSRYNWRSVTQFVKVSSPLFDLWPGISFCPKVVWKFLCCLCRTPSLTRGRVCHLSFSVYSTLSVFTSSIYVTWTGLYNIKIHIVPHRKHLTSLLQRPTNYWRLKRQWLFIARTIQNTKMQSLGRT